MGSEESSPRASRSRRAAPAAPAAPVERPEPVEPAGAIEPVEPGLEAGAEVGPEVEASRGDGRWSVVRAGWKAVLPDLPEESASLLATPIVVSVEASGDGRGGEDGRAGENDRGGEEDDEGDRVGRHRAPASGRYEYRPTFLAPDALRPAGRARHRV